MITRNIVKLSLILPVLCGLFVSCTSWYDTGPSAGRGENATVTFVLNVPGNSVPATRGLSESDETNIETIDVLLFRKAGGDRLYYGNVLGVSIDNSQGNVKNFKAVIPVKDYDNYDITVIANGRDVLSGAGLSPGDEKSVVLGKLIKTVPAGEKWNSNRIPMWGEALNVEIDGNTGLSGGNAIKMTRMIARIDVKLSRKAATGSDVATATGNANFELSSVRLYNYSTRGTIAPDLMNGWASGEIPKATSPNRPEGGYGTALYGDGNEPLVYTAGDQHVSASSLPDSLIRAIYTLEAPKGSGSTLATNTCLVIGGKYKGDVKETFYRIDIAQKNTASQQYEYLPLLRNHRYLINITKISGTGFGTPDEAFYSQPVNIEAGILEWNDGDIGDIIFDGQYYLGINPTEFQLYKDAKTGNKITVTTDVPVGWSIAGVTDSDKSGSGNAVDWIYDIARFSTPGSKDELTFKVKENTTGSVRQAWIHIKAGRLNFAVKVTQSAESEQESYQIIVTDANGTEVSELFFTGAAATTPASQDFKVRWSPSGSLLRATLIPDGSNPLSGSYNPTLTANYSDMLTWNQDGRTYTVSPNAIGTSSEPFFEKSAKVLFELQTPMGPVTKILNLRQTNFNLIPKTGVMLMDGTPQSFRVCANFTWKAEFVSASSEDAPSFANSAIVRKFDTQYGGNNTTSGDPVTFTCTDFISNYKDSNPKTAVVKVRFSRLEKGQWIVYGTYDIFCYAAIPVCESNSYMINNNKPMPILIPVSQLGYAMKASTSGFLGSGWIKNYGKLKVQVLWSDVYAFGTADAVVKAVSYNGAMNVNDGKIVVVPGSSAGNSVIILYEDNNDNGIYDSGDDIRWSWHIWNSTYYPYDANRNPVASGTDNRWMDRNLGAMSNTPNDVKSLGFLYQWGRKDPFPSNNQWNSTFSDYLYYAAGSGVTFAEVPIAEATNLPNSVTNPLTRYLCVTSPYDWFTTVYAQQNGDLWGGGTTTDFLHASGKSVYDPCPEGYRVPKYGADGWGTTLTESSWLGFVNRGRINNNYGGYYPAAGGRDRDSDKLDGNISTGGYYWQNSTNGASGRQLHIDSGKVDPNVGSSRAYAFSVRCVAE